MLLCSWTSADIELNLTGLKTMFLVDNFKQSEGLNSELIISELSHAFVLIWICFGSFSAYSSVRHQAGSGWLDQSGAACHVRATWSESEEVCAEETDLWKLHDFLLFLTLEHKRLQRECRARFVGKGAETSWWAGQQSSASHWLLHNKLHFKTGGFFKTNI